MTIPMVPQAQRTPDGYVQLGGGYEDAISQAQRQVPQQQISQQQVPLQQQIQQGLQQNQLPPQMQQAPQQGQRFGDPGMLQQRNLQAFQQQQLAQQFAQQQQQPQVATQPQQVPQGLDLNTRLTGPNIPAHLQGRTVGEVLQIESGLRQTHMQLMAQQGSPLPPTSQQQLPTQQQSTAQGQNQGQGWDWKNPQQSVEQAVEKALGPKFQQLEAALAPVVQNTNIMTMEKARDMAAAAIGPAFNQHYAAIVQSLNGIDPNALKSPATWQVAAERLIGAMTIQAARQQPQTPGIYPAQQVPPTQQPMPNLNSFFSEQPNQGGPGAQGVTLTPMQLQAAAAMGMTPESYAAYYTPVAQQSRMQPSFSVGGRF